MQSFLPYPDYAKSASVLDRSRLGKQRVENLQIMQALVGDSRWACHPAVKMWAGYEQSLMEYQLAICTEWTKVRGYQDTCLGKTLEIAEMSLTDLFSGEIQQPYWLGSLDFHLSHQSNLIRKRPDIYGPLWPDVPNDLPYVWPTRGEHLSILL